MSQDGVESRPLPYYLCLICPSQSKVHGVQKKAYRVLEEVCASSQGPAACFVQSHLDDLKKTLLDSLQSTSSPAKRVRALGCWSAREEGHQQAHPGVGVTLGDPTIVVVPTAPFEVSHTYCEKAVS